MRRITALLTDRRARVPFALLGIALLVVSGLFVVQLETRDEQGPPRETDRAMERTESATETALADALAAASEQAAREPMTDPAETAYGEVLADGGNPFDQYLRALVYLEAQDRVETAGQQVGGVQTTVSLPEIDNHHEFEEAVERVALRPGSETKGIESGVIEAEISGVETVATRDGEVIERQRDSVTVAVSSPLYELHDRTSTFQERLDAGISKPGFSQRFNARIYALGWARGYAQYSGLPVTEVIANRHVVPSANDAVYRTQKDVFGAADPNLNNAIRRGWLCMAMHDAEGLYNSYAGKTTNVSKSLCDASKWLFGNQATGDVPEAPGATDLLGEAPGMDAKHTIGVNKTSLLPIRDLATGTGSSSVSNAIGRIYEMRVRTEVETEVLNEATLRHDPPHGVTSSHVVETTTEEVDIPSVEVTNPEPEDEFNAVEGEVRLEFTEKKEHHRATADGRETVTTEATGTKTVAFEIAIEEQQRNPNAKIDEYNHAGPTGVAVNEEFVYNPGPGVATAATDRTIPVGGDGGTFENYERVGERPLYAVFVSHGETGGPEYDDVIGGGGDKTMTERIERQLEKKWRTQSADDLEFDRRATVSLPVPSRHALQAAIIYDLRQIQKKVSDITHTFKRSEIIHDGSETGPYGELLDKVRDHKEKYLDREQPFASIGQKTIYEARHAYFSALEGYLERIEDAHSSSMNEIDDELPDKGIENAMKYLQQGVTATPPDPVPLDSSSLTDNVTYEVSGSPTYLVTDSVTSETVPAVDNDEDGFAPMAARNRNYLKLPYDSVVKGLLNSIANRFGFGNSDAELTFQMASEALVAGEEASEAADADPDYGDTAKLQRLNGEVRSAVESSVKDYKESVGAQIAFQLYANDIEVNGIDVEPSRSRENCDGEDCFVVPDDCTPMACGLDPESNGADAYGEVTEAVAKAIDNYGGTAETANGIASGEISDPIVDRVSSAVGDNLRPEYADGMGDDEWQAVVRSATQHVVQDAAAEHGVTLSDTDTVESLDTEIRQTLEKVSTDIVKNRFDAAVGNATFDIENYDNWVKGIRTPVRVPAGMPILPLPGKWFATVNLWDVKVKGEYARFEVTANMATPETATATTYVREDRDVERTIAGDERELGSVEEIDFSGRSALIVVVPPGKVGVGDRDDEDPECSQTWPVVGDVSDGTVKCGSSSVDMPAVAPSAGEYGRGGQP